jgi:hypothetical protein
VKRTSKLWDDGSLKFEDKLMIPSPERPEIDHRTIKLLVGVIAIALAPLTSLFATSRLTSISASYHEGGWSQSIFVGGLFAIAALMLAYNGNSRTEMVLSKVASLSGVCVALFPCGCGSHAELLPKVHVVSAAVMFLILAYFCYEFYRVAKSKTRVQATVRATIYALCGLSIVFAIVALAFANRMRPTIPRITFYGETSALVAFGISWLTASRILPVLTGEDERFSPLRASNPE